MARKTSSSSPLSATATVRGASTVNVSSNSIRDINPITLTAALSGQVALAATVGVVLVGSGATSDEMSVLNAGASSGDSSSGTLGNAGAVTQTDVVGGVGGGVDGISAQILNSDVTASSIGITAASQMATRNIAGSLSIGVAELINADPAAAISAADEALYRAKQAGRDRVVL